MNQEWLQDALERVKKKKKADEVSLLLASENENLTRFAENHVTQNTTRHRLRLYVTAIADKRRGTAETSNITSRGLTAALRRAEAIAKALPQDPEFISLPRSQRYLKVERFYPQTAELPPDIKAKVIREVTAEAASRKMKSAGIYRTGEYASYVANTEGLFGTHHYSSAEFSITASCEGASGSAVAEEENVTDISPQALAIEAFRNAEMGKNPRELKPGTYKTLLTPRALGEMMPFVVFQMNRRAADEGRSFFRGKLGKKIISKKLSLAADPTEPANPGSPIDLYNDGIARKKTTFIEDGTLTNLWNMRYWARKQQIPVVSPTFNISLTGGKYNLNQMIKKIDRGLLVMHLWYIRYVNPMELILTGTSRDGLFLVEKGKIKHAVKNMRFNDSPMRLLRNPASIGVRERRGGSMLLPSVIVRDFNWSSQTTF